MIDYDRYDRVRAVQWRGDALALLDQRLLPLQEAMIECRDAFQVAQAIANLTVRGAPAIGIAAAYGVVLAARAHADGEGRVRAVAIAAELEALRTSRPTAVNLFWALERMQAVLDDAGTVAALEAAAVAIERDDLAANRHMGSLGAATGLDSVGIVEDEGARALAVRLIAEAVAVGGALGYSLQPILGAAATVWAGAAVGDAIALRDAQQAFLARRAHLTPGARSSTAQDILRGRRTEIDAINGAVWKRGAARGIVTPANELLTRLLHARSSVERKPQ